MPLSRIEMRPHGSPSPHFGKASWHCPTLTPEVVWRGGLATVRALLDGGPEDLAKVMVDGEIVKDRAMLPGADGVTGPEEWFARTRRAAGPDAPILFYARDLPRYDRELFEVLLSAAAGVLGRYGLSPRPVDVELFYGEYRATPGGIHREFCANNHLVLAGRKSMHFWAGDGWIPAHADRDHAGGPVGDAEEEYLPSVTIDSVAAHGVALPAGAGEMFNWANGVWHVGETDGPALAVNFARYMTSFAVGEEGFPLAPEPNGRVAADRLTDYRAFLTARVDAAGALATASSYGIPGADPVVTYGRPPASVTSATHAPVLWCADADGVLVATHGRARRFPSAVVPFLDEIGGLAVGERYPVPAGAGELVTWLVTHSALTADRDG